MSLTSEMCENGMPRERVEAHLTIHGWAPITLGLGGMAHAELRKRIYAIETSTAQAALLGIIRPFTTVVEIISTPANKHAERWDFNDDIFLAVVARADEYGWLP